MGSFHFLRRILCFLTFGCVRVPRRTPSKEEKLPAPTSNAKYEHDGLKETAPLLDEHLKTPRLTSDCCTPVPQKETSKLGVTGLSENNKLEKENSNSEPEIKLVASKAGCVKRLSGAPFKESHPKISKPDEQAEQLGNDEDFVKCKTMPSTVPSTTGCMKRQSKAPLRESQSVVIESNKEDEPFGREKNLPEAKQSSSSAALQTGGVKKSSGASLKQEKSVSSKIKGKDETEDGKLSKPKKTFKKKMTAPKIGCGVHHESLENEENLPILPSTERNDPRKDKSGDKKSLKPVKAFPPMWKYWK